VWAGGEVGEGGSKSNTSSTIGVCLLGEAEDPEMEASHTYRIRPGRGMAVEVKVREC